MSFRAIVLFLVFCSSLRAATEQLYVLRGGHDPASGIMACNFDDATGKPGSLATAALAASPSFFTFSPDAHFLYAVRNSTPETVDCFSVQTDHSLKLLSEQPTGQKGGCHVSVDARASTLFLANYNVGSLQSFPIDAAHRLGPAASLIPLLGSGPNPQRQTSAHGHSIYLDPAGRFVYACDLGSDKIWIFQGGPLPALVPNDPPFAVADPGSGPRHLAFSPNGKWIYVVNEMGVSVTAFAQNGTTGALDKMETVSCLPAGASTAGLGSAEIFCSPSGRWLYVSNRDVSNHGLDSLSVFAIGLDGKLTLVQNLPALVHMPRSFAVDLSGRWLVAAGEKSNQLAVFAIDPEKGTLILSGHVDGVIDPMCVAFAPRP